MQERKDRVLKVIALLTVATFPLTVWASPQAHEATVPLVERTFAHNCASCHELHAGESRAPLRSALAEMTPEAIYDALTSGPMVTNAAALTDEQKRDMAEYLSGRPMGSETSGDAAGMTNRCAKKPLSNPFEGPIWNGWGVDLTNGRYQPASEAKLSAAEVPRLKLKWAFGFPLAISAWTQPTVAGNRVYVSSSNAFVYSLDATSGCVYWSFKAKAGVRSAITIGPALDRSTPTVYPLYFGDVKANVYALDAATGTLLWSKSADSHPSARITGAPKLFEGRLYVPIASFEELTRASSHECCTFRGSVVAFKANDGEQIWKSYSILSEPTKIKKSADGVQQWGPSGAGIWGSPTIDQKRRLLYVGTGNGYSEPATGTSDAVLAIALDTGKLAWAHQLTPGDVSTIKGATFTSDLDIGASIILRTLREGHDNLIASQKSGVTYALDPDNRGEELWEHRTGQGDQDGGTMFGPAADDQLVYVANADSRYGPAEAGGLFALRLNTGDEVWHWKPAAPPNCGLRDLSCTPSQSAAVTVIPGVVFSGSDNGIIRAFSAIDGHVIWEFSTMQKFFQTVNGVEAHGGSMGGPGATVAGGMVFVNSGYGHTYGIPGNVLLAFGVK